AGGTIEADHVPRVRGERTICGENALTPGPVHRFMELSTTLRTFAGSTSASSMTDRNFESPVNSSSVDLTFLSRSSRCGVKAIRRRLTPSRAWRPEQGEVGRGGRGQRASVFAAPVGRVGADALDHGAAAGATDGEV